MTAIVATYESKGAWKPPQQAEAPTYYVLIDSSMNSRSASQSLNDTTAIPIVNGVPTVSSRVTAAQLYVFDAVLRVDHQQDSQITSQPVQTGANISDHAYTMPARVTLDIGMSDAMASYADSTHAPSAAAAGGVWDGPSKSKSVNAFNEIVSWATNRLILTLGTRLKKYDYMMVESVSPEESNKTIASLRCRVVFKQVFIANIQSVANSALPQTTQAVTGGATNGVPPTLTQTAQFMVNEVTNVLGAGPWSSFSAARKLLA